ncbi:esterase-like activity of phytase family protein [Erythrobacter sp. BLCC-B19]|uniref:esterase-like activity of phytase family protein n=1 Tax=Erythrobacter sp. BLCC-B19 TaxID=3025315 RepID=UPI002360E504|nr:esterase-like activity of phytase family protein [Erythrobacter sp. BLCC-B19]WDA40485.1 peptidylprolyl isomerase [Erythrobacter sp. BLCC-B19]
MTWKRALATALALLLAAPLAAQEEFFPATEPVEFAPGQSEGEVGELIFRGGVAIAPDKAQIGGISSLTWHDGQLYAVTDDGRRVVMTPDDQGSRLVDVSSISLAPLRDAKGGKLGSKERGDAEAITRLASGEWLVAFEQEHRIWRYADLAGPATGEDSRAAALLAGAAPNEGIETLAAYDGGLLACGEWADPARPNCLRITDSGAVSFALAAPEGIAEAGGVPTDAACRKDGSCFVLFRSYQASQGNRAAIVALAPDNSAATLAVLTPPLTLDNFEGLALREEPGHTFLYLASDDNFRNCETRPGAGCQRTLLMKFELKPPPAGPAPLTAQDFGPTRSARPAVRPFPEAASVSVVLETSLGPITIALETERAPITAGNFLRYVDEKRLDGTTFYRAMDVASAYSPSGVLQGGARGDPKRVRAPIAHEPTNLTGLSHTHGAVAMASLGAGTADGDFFIMIEDQTGLDADPSSSDPTWRDGYAVFGHVTAGMDIVAAIHAAPRDPEQGEGLMKGQMLAEPVRIITARRAAPAP